MPAILSVVIFESQASKVDGKCTIYLRVQFKGKPKYISLKEKILPHHFIKGGKNGNYITRTAPHAGRLNTILKKKFQEAEDIRLEMEVQDIPFTFEIFKARYTFSNIILLDYFFEQFRINPTYTSLSPNTIKTYTLILNVFARVVGNIQLKSISEFHINKFYKYQQQQASERTARQYLNILQGLFKLPVKERVIKDKNWFIGFNLTQKRVNPKKADLTIEEIDRFKDLFFDWDTQYDRLFPTPKKWKNSFTKSKITRKEVLRIFLFACHASGIRHNDAIQVKFGHLKQYPMDGHVFWTIEKEAKTSKQQDFIPILPDGINFVDFGRKLTDDSLIFNMVHIDSFNKHLKIIASALGIIKKVTSHVARHTFTELSNKMGMSIHDLSQLLGHSSIEMTKKNYLGGNRKQALLNAMQRTWGKEAQPTMPKHIEYPDHIKKDALRIIQEMKKLYKDRGLSAKKVGEMLGKEGKGMSRAQAARFFNGEIATFDMSLFLDFCRVMEIDPVQMLKTGLGYAKSDEEE